MKDITFEEFERQVKLIYDRIPEKPSFTYEDVVNVFECFFDTHKAYTGGGHWRLKAPQIKRFIENMPICDDTFSDEYIELFPEDYPPMIEQYYATYDEMHNGSGYTPNIEHFFAGKIRAICYYEACY